jgi:hypothetical protein
MHNERRRGRFLRRRGQRPGHHNQYLRGAASIGLGTTIKYLP